MSTVYVKTSNLDITHEDQEQHGLKFQVMTQKDGLYYIEVIGEDAEITTWKTRVSGQDSSLDEINAVKASFPNPQNDINTLQNVLSELIKESLE